MDLPIANELIDLGSIVVLAAVAMGVISKIRGGSMHHFDRWQMLNAPKRLAGGASSYMVAIRGFFAVLFRDVFAARVLETCSRGKRLSHLATFWGFVFLGASTTLAFLTNPANLVLPLDNPVKLFGNAGGVLVVVGFVAMFHVRYREHAPVWRLTRSDLFLMTLLLTVVTGFVTQQAVYSSLGDFWISDTFWVHMVFVVVLLATAPFTKFFHAISKPVAILRDEVDSRLGKEPYLPVAAADSEEVKSG